MLKKKPNMIVIYCDDLGYGDLGCYGSDTVITPHLDQLADQGVRFTQWYSNSPVCSPSRASLLTGCYPAKVGVNNILGGKRGTAGLPPEEMTLASWLKTQGYRTGLMGKWHLGLVEESRPNAHGFDESFGFLAGCVDYYSHIFYWQQGAGVNPVHDLWHNDTEVWNDGKYLTNLITEKSVQFIEQPEEQPFFLYVPYNAPHYPMHAPQEYMDRFKHLPWDRQVMAAMISAVDDGVGEIVESLKRQGLYEDTIIFFSSDNGPSVESRNWLDGNEDLYYGGSAGILRGHKGSLFEGGIREPAILCYPARIAGGQVCDELAMMMDVFPTFMDLAELPLPPLGKRKLDGRSVVPIVTSEGALTPHEQVFWEYDGQLAIRKGDWKLVLDGRLHFGHPQEPVFLCDVVNDPSERINLKDQHPELVVKMSESVRAWFAEVTKPRN